MFDGKIKTSTRVLAVVALFWNSLFTLAPSAVAQSTPTFQANASATVPINLLANCPQSQAGGPGQTAATATCQFSGPGPTGADVTLKSFATVDMNSGAMSAIAISDDTNLGLAADGGGGFIVSGTIRGTQPSGRMTLSDNGIAWTTSGPDGSGSLTLEITDGFRGNSVCNASPPASQGCGTGSSASVALDVNNGDQVTVTAGINCGAADNSTCQGSDGLTLTLSPGLQFVSDVPGFLGGAVPTITSPNAASFTEGQPGSFRVTTTGSPAPTVTITGGIPVGTQFANNGDGTATLSGTPGAGTAGTYPLTFAASNSVGTSQPQSFTLTVQSGANTVDTTAPSTAIALTPSTPNGQNGWYTSIPTVTVAASDPDTPAAVIQTRCTLDPTTPPASFGTIPSGCAYLSPGQTVTDECELHGELRLRRLSSTGQNSANRQ